ncbi:MAG: sigma-70 family RNA polymerase sigma factor, partial [Bacteroidota bacterium]
SERNKYMGRIEEFDHFVPIDKIEQEAEEKEIQFNKMAEAMEKLGEPCRSILRDFYLKKMSMQEICEKMGYTNADNAKNQKYKCLQRLKKIFFRAYQKNEP